MECIYDTKIDNDKVKLENFKQDSKNIKMKKGKYVLESGEEFDNIIEAMEKNFLNRNVEYFNYTI